jgi:polyisoprenyl-phosphate glycosyltransferase
MSELMRPSSAPSPSLLVLIPIYNDWDAVSQLLGHLDRVMQAAALAPRVLLVDDGSTMTVDTRIAQQSYSALERVDVLKLRRNLGHQRAIAIALAYVEDYIKPTAVLVMDGDGEDTPDDAIRLVKRSLETDGDKVIFAERTRRSESAVFRTFYNLYRFAHLLLTGMPVRVGNFSVVPARQLTRLVVVSELWNHYAAAVFKAGLPRDTIPTARGQRISGQSRMNFVALVGHGLSALSVHAELIGVRLLLVSAIFGSVVCLLLAVVLSLRVATNLVIPGWATTAAGLLLVVLFETVAFAMFFVFLILHARSQPLFIPIRDYTHFVEGVMRLAGRADQLSGQALAPVAPRT